MSKTWVSSTCFFFFSSWVSLFFWRCLLIKRTQSPPVSFANCLRLNKWDSSISWGIFLFQMGAVGGGQGFFSGRKVGDNNHGLFQWTQHGAITVWPISWRRVCAEHRGHADALIAPDQGHALSRHSLFYSAGIDNIVNTPCSTVLLKVHCVRLWPE